MQKNRRPLILALIALALPASAEVPAPPETAQKCGGSFQIFSADFTADALGLGVAPIAVEAWMEGARLDRAVMWSDRKHSVFRKPFVELAASLVTLDNLTRARTEATDRADLLTAIESRTGVPQAVLLALWGVESDFGSFLGLFNTRDALLTLAHDCRRSAAYRPEAMAALQLFANDRLSRDARGTWTGGIGMLHMLPAALLAQGVDGDGDGLITPDTSASDALGTAAARLKQLGWRPGEPWLAEVVLPETFDWALSGLDNALPVTQWAALGVAPRAGSSLEEGQNAALLLPQGRKGPAFLAYANFSVLQAWQSESTQALALGYFATVIAGAEPIRQGNPDPQLSREVMQALQRRLQTLGHPLDKLDGVLREDSRAAIQTEQERLGLPADGWPTAELMEML